MTSTDRKSLAEALPEQIERVSGLVALYKTVPYGDIAAAMMQADIRRAHTAMMEADLTGMIEAYEALEGWKDE